MIEFYPENYFHAFWFVYPPSAEVQQSGIPNMDMIAALYKQPDGRWHFIWRFAYYDKDNNDLNKSWHEGYTNEDDIPKLEVGIQKIVDLTVFRNRSKFDKIVLRCYGDEAMQKMLDANTDWFRMKREATPEEAAEAEAARIQKLKRRQ